MTCFPTADGDLGNYPLEPLSKGWTNWAISYLSKGKVVTRVEILDLNGIRYLQEPLKMIALKCLELFLALPFYFCVYTAIHLIRLPIVSIWNCSLKAYLKQVWTIVRIPFYWVALQSAALYGVFNPLDGRALFSLVERGLHEGKTRRASLQYKKSELSFNELCWNTFSEKEDSNVIFIGFCMQPIGTIEDPHIQKNHSYQLDSSNPSSRLISK